MKTRSFFLHAPFVRAAGAAIASLIGAAGASGQLVDNRVPLNFNFHGMAQTTEAVVAAPASNADVINFRGISDRGLYWDPSDPHAIGSAPLIGTTGITYGLFNSVGYTNATSPNASTYSFDMVHIGNRVINRVFEANTNQLTTGGSFPAWAPARSITSISGDGATVTVTTASAHGWRVGNGVLISGVTPSGYSGVYTITSVPTSNTFTYANTTSGAASGSIVANTSTVSSISGDGFTVSVTTAAVHGLSAGSTVVIAGSSINDYNGTFTVTAVPTTTTFTYSSSATGTPTGTFMIAGVCDNSSADQVTTLASPIVVDARTEIGVLYMISDSGGQFDTVLTFNNGAVDTNVTVRLAGADWFGNATEPAIVAGQPVTFQKKMAHAQAVSVSDITGNGTVATVTTSSPHSFVAGTSVTIAGATPGGFNSTYTVLGTPAPTSTTFAISHPMAATASGTITATANFTTFRGVANNDSAALQTFSSTNAGPNLNVTEGIISIPAIIAAGNNVAGQSLTKIAFRNATWPTQSITALTGNGTTVTATVASNAGYIVGQPVIIAGATPAGYNGTYTITGLVAGNQFTYANTTTGTTTGTRTAARVGIGRGYSIYAVTARTGSPANSSCATAQNVTAGQTAGTNIHTVNLNTPSTCGGGNDTTAVWYRYTAGGTGVHTIEARTCQDSGPMAQVIGVTGVATVSAASSVVVLPLDTTMEVYSGACGSLTPVACNDDGCSVSSRVQWQASPGSVYYIRVAGKNNATGSFTLSIDDPAHVDLAMPIQFNWNGICHGTQTISPFTSEQTVTTPVVHENRSDLNGFRAIADRGLLFDPNGTTTNALNYGGTVGYRGMLYQVYNTALQADMVHLGNRNLAASGLRQWSIAGTTWPPSTSDNGLRPIWLDEDNHTDAQVSNMTSLGATFGPNTRIGILYHISNVDTLVSGTLPTIPKNATFDVILTFQDSSTVTVTVRGIDWFGGASANPYNQLLPTPDPLSGVEVQRVLGIYHGVQNTDRGTDSGAAAQLKVQEAVISTASLQAMATPFDPTVHGQLTSIAFGNLQSGNGVVDDHIYSAVGIYAATLRDAASFNLNFGPGGVGTVVPNQLPVGATGKMTVTTSRGSGSPNNISSVVVDASSIGLSSTFALNDSGLSGDVQANDNVWTSNIGFPINAGTGTFSLPFTVRDQQNRTATGNIIFTLVPITGSIAPTTAMVGTNVTATMTLSPTTGGANDIASVLIDASSIGIASPIAMLDNGVAPDVTIHDGIYTASFTVPLTAAAGLATLPVTITDVSARVGTGSLSFTVIAPPTTAADLGTLATGFTTYTDTLNAGEVKWIKFTLGSPVNVASNNFLDIDTEGSLLAASNDTMLGLYDANGALIVSDDDDGSNLLTAMSFGATTPARSAFGNGTAYNGRDGNLAAGTYYMAYCAFASTFGATGWNVTTTSANAGSYVIRFALSTVPAGGPPASFTDLGTLGATTVTNTQPLASGGVTWFKFTLATEVNTDARTYLDIDTENSEILDTEIALFRDDGSGTLVSVDDDSGTETWSQLTYGRGTRFAPGNGLNYDGRNGATLAAGTYFLAVTEHAASFGSNFIVFFNTGTTAGNVTVNITNGTQPPPIATILAGPITNPANNHQYYLYGAGLTWLDAEANAVLQGGHLATINDADENEWVRVNVLMFDATDRRGWIGLNDRATVNTYVWTSGEPVNFLNWNAGEPSHSGGTEFYVEMLGNGLWNDNNNVGAAGVCALVEIPGPAGCNLADITGIGGPPSTPDGILTGDDFNAFIAAFANSDLLADVCGIGGPPSPPDGLITGDDFNAFIAAFAGGCP